MIKGVAFKDTVQVITLKNQFPLTLCLPAKHVLKSPLELG